MTVEKTETETGKTVSLADVARSAGVSQMTVIRVLRDYEHVKPDTRRKVLQACAAQNYRQNLVASSLRTKRSYTLGVACPKLEHSYFARLVNSTQATAAEAGYHVLVVQLEKRYPEEQMLEELEFLLQRQIDGLIVSMSPLRDTVRAYLSREQIPIVLGEQPADGFSYVGTDDFGGAREAVAYLSSLGHERIAHLGGLVGSYTAQQRLNGYKQALAESGLSFEDDLVIATDYDMTGGYEAAKELLDRGTRFSAVFAANDYVAVGAMAALAEGGARVPEDVSVIGFAGDKLGDYYVPRLTTVYQPIEDVGRKLVQLLLEKVESPEVGPSNLILPTKLIHRQSCTKSNLSR